MISAQHLAGLWAETRTEVARRLFLDRHAEFWLGEIAPARSLSELRAKVVSVTRETDDTKTFALRPNAAWRGHLAGQYTSIEVEIDGVRVRRCYSISSPPGRLPIALTVKRIPGGLVSTWMHEALRPGDVVRLGPATGGFTLPTATPARLLLLSGGSGITPVMSILRDLAARAAVRDVVFVHHARTRDSVIFGDELEELARCHPGLRLVLCLDDDGAPAGFDEDRLAALVPDFAERSTFVCGPAGMMDRVERLWADAGASCRLESERFVAAPSPAQLTALGADVDVYLTGARRRIVAGGPGPLLEQLERAGAHPQSGCRIGVCRSCVCRKRSGTVQNLITGEVSTRPDEDVQLCISMARSDLQLDL